MSKFEKRELKNSSKLYRLIRRGYNILLVHPARSLRTIYRLEDIFQFRTP